MNEKLKLAHLIVGRIIGGIERDFVEFLSHSPKNVSQYIVTKNKFHPLINDKVKNASQNIFSIKYLGNKKIPIFLLPLRSKYVTMKIKNIQPDAWLLWSTLPKFSTSFIFNYKTIYYDHGKAWFNKDFNQKTVDFLNNSSAIICISHATKRMLELKWKINNKNMKVCLNALRPSCKVDNPKIKFIDKSKPITIGIAGRQISFKGFPLVIHAVNELKKRKIPFKLLVAGIGEKLDDLKKLTVQLNLENDVNFLGLVEDMNEFYSQIDLFICPSIREPFGLVNLEAMAHGCPIIVAGVDGMPEILKGSNAGIAIKPTFEIEKYIEFGGSIDLLQEVEYVYDPYTDTIIRPRILDPVHIANVIEELWSNPDRFSEMSKNAIDHVNNKFDYGKHVEELYTIIEDVITK